MFQLKKNLQLSTLEKLYDYLNFKKYSNTIEKCLIQIEQSKESNPYLKLGNTKRLTCCKYFFNE